MVQATEKVVPILVDCTQQGAHQAYLNTYTIRGFPTLLFVASDGSSLGMADRRDAASLIQGIDRYASQKATRSMAPVLAIFAVLTVAVVGGLVFVYKKWLAAAEE